MGCNAWNHPPDCNCGWGGDTSWGDNTTNWINKTSYSIPAYPTAPPLPIADGKSWHKATLKKPNAHCPVCLQPVYFVETQNGGRVFFDELGPPWPKHPCTDNEVTRLSVNAFSGNSWTTEAKGAQNEWHLLSSSKVKIEEGIIEIEGCCFTLDKYLRLRTETDTTFGFTLGKYLHLRTETDTTFDDSSPVLVKPLENSGAFEVSYITVDKQKQIKAETKLFYPSYSRENLDLWKRAFSGDEIAQSKIGWKHSTERRRLMPNVIKFPSAQAYEDTKAMIATVLTGAEIALWVDGNEEVAQALLTKINEAFAAKERLIAFTAEEMQVCGPYLQWSSKEELKQKLRVLLNL